MTASCRSDGGMKMLYDALIYDCETVADLDEPTTSAILINGLSQREAEILCDILSDHETNICLFPYKE